MSICTPNSTTMNFSGVWFGVHDYKLVLLWLAMLVEPQQIVLVKKKQQSVCSVKFKTPHQSVLLVLFLNTLKCMNLRLFLGFLHSKKLTSSTLKMSQIRRRCDMHGELVTQVLGPSSSLSHACCGRCIYWSGFFSVTKPRSADLLVCRRVAGMESCWTSSDIANARPWPWNW